MICDRPDMGPNEILSTVPRVRRDATGHIDFENPNLFSIDHILFLKITSNLTGVGLYRRPFNVS